MMVDPYIIEPEQGVGVDLFHPGDAEGVVRLFRTVYGEGYPIKTFTDPDRLIEENAAGRTISSVARTPKGDIVGHNALFSSGPYSGIRESGAGVVHPDYRGGKGIFTGLIIHGQEVGAKKFRIETIYGEPICNHIYSQKAAAGLGWITHAIEIDLMLAEAYGKEKSASGRVAALLDFKTLKPKSHTVYLPAVYEETLRFVYSDLDDDRQITSADRGLPFDSTTDMKTQIFDFAKVARLAVHEAGADFERVFDEEEKKVRERGVIVLQVWVKLSWPWVDQVVELLRKRSYFLGGILPRWFDVDGLLMQKILGQPNWEQIQLYSDRARRLLEFVKADWQEVWKDT